MKRDYSSLKMAVIAGASEALKQRSKNAKITDEQIIRDITARIDEIVEKIDN
ncbi:MAG: hypothetical protein QXJ28_02655 [Candidatus Pacearchaeota archaeon]